MVNLIVSIDTTAGSLDVGDLLITTHTSDRYTVAFRYDSDYIEGGGYAVDPNVRLDAGWHNLGALPLAFEDASPDHWGQTLLQRAERRQAGRQQRGARTLNNVDFLVSASDHTRQGALRFREHDQGPFLAPTDTVPKMVAMPTLLADAEQVAADPNTDNWAAVKRLLDTGTSALGGARPKAALEDDQGRLWLAKFPRFDDTTDVPGWEMVALNIAERAGLSVPSRALRDVGGKRVLLVRRFDRDDDGTRVGYISARTLLNKADAGAVADYGAVGIGRRLRVVSSSPKHDIEQLWRQATVNLLVNNTDNHLRNLGLLRQGPGWRLAPVFDLDPNPDTGTEFATHLAGAAYRLPAVGRLFDLASDLGISGQRARAMLEQVREAVRGWESDAASYAIPGNQIDLYRDTFTGLDAGLDRLLRTPS